MSAATLELAKLMVTQVRYPGTHREEYLPLSSHTKDVTRLLKGGADVHLVVCAYRIDSQIYHRLLDSQSDADFFEGSYKDHYPAAAPSGEHDLTSCISRLLTPVFDAAASLDSEALSTYANFGAQMNKITANIVQHRFPLHKVQNPFVDACRSGRQDVFEQLLRLTNPGDAFLQRWLGESLSDDISPLWDPWTRPHDKLGVLALEHGADLAYSRFSKGKTQDVINLIACCSRSPVVLSRERPKLVTTFSLDEMTEIRDRPGRAIPGITTLMIAVGSASIAVCDSLLESGADPNEHDLFGMTALTEAIYVGHNNAVVPLLARGADPNHVIYGRPLELGVWEFGVSSKANSTYTMWLKERETDVVMFGAKRWSAIHLAAYYGREKTLKALHEAGADLKAADVDGLTALDVAMQHSQTAAAFYLFGQQCPFDNESPAFSQLLRLAIEEYEHNFIHQTLGHAVASASVSEQEGKQFATDDDMPVAATEGQYYPLEPPSLAALGCCQQVKLINGMSLCTNCFRTLSTKTMDTVHNQNTQTQICNVCRLLTDCGYSQAQGNWVAHVFVDDTAENQLSFEFNGQSLRHNLRIVPDDLHITLDKIRLLPDDSTSSLAATLLAAHWLRTCIESHPQCGDSHESNYMPTRLLHIGSIEKGQLPRLVQHSSFQEPYVALSHRWGLRGLPVTTSKNIANRVQGIDLPDLSPVMRDAIHIVRGLGFSYIWIDALCIVQDSSDDWLSEASKMSSVFSGAVVTIAVADAEDHSQGIFRKRVAQCTRPFMIPTSTIAQRGWMDIDGNAKYYVFPKTGLVTAGARTKGMLDNRGWILQEQLLSKRILYYDKGEIYWDCITLSACESSPIAVSLLDEKDPDEAWASKLLRRTLAGSSSSDLLRKRLSDAWLEIIKNYSARTLTKSHDRLVALTGILEPLKLILGEIPVAGMWQDQLWRQLTWWVHTTTPAHEMKNVFHAPSWSWLSVPKRVYYHNSLLGEDPKTQAVLHKFTELRPYYFEIKSAESRELPGTAGVVGTMTVTAKCFPYHLTATDLKRPVQKRWNQAKWKLNTGRWMFDVPVEAPLDVHCLIVAEDQLAKMIVCLCIVPVDDAGDKWKRIGLCHWDGLAWQVPSYFGTTPETRTLTLI